MSFPRPTRARRCSAAPRARRNSSSERARGRALRACVARVARVARSAPARTVDAPSRRDPPRAMNS